MFNTSKYTTWYYNLILSGKAQDVNRKEGYYERHHVIPKSLGGSNKRDNIVRLTYREHFIAHWLLTKMCINLEHTRKMCYALQKMTHKRSDIRRIIPSRYYEIGRRKASEASRGRKTGRDVSGSKNPFYGKSHTPETRKVLSEARIGHYGYWNGKEHSNETKEKLRKAKLGKKASSETKAKQSEAHRGKVLTVEHKKKIGEAKLGVPRPTITCPHCGKIGGVGIMHCWHFENCRLVA